MACYHVADEFTMVVSLSDLQVDAGGSGCINHDSGFQSKCFVLLLQCHVFLWTVVTDVPPQRPGVSPNTGTLHGHFIWRAAE